MYLHPGDELPLEFGRTRTKYIHTVGAVGQVEWRDLGGHQYSGIFSGALKARAESNISVSKMWHLVITIFGIIVQLEIH